MSHEVVRWIIRAISPEGKKYWKKIKVKKPKERVLYQAKNIPGTTQAGIIGEKLDEKEQ